MLLMIDNYDSFTYILVQYFMELGVEVCVYYNDEITLDMIQDLQPSQIVISPGPCTPNESGVSLDAIRRFAGIIPILGVCLGHEAIGQVFGARIVHAKAVVHGKASPIYHRGIGIFAGLPNPVQAARYHSLAVDRESLPDCLEITAWTQGSDGQHGEIMGLRHRTLEIEGAQFHPESILTEHGHQMLQNFVHRAAPTAQPPRLAELPQRA